MVKPSGAQILLVLSMPRAGSSATAKTLLSLGAQLFSWSSEISQNASEHNSQGYFEDSRLNLLNDNVLRLAYGDFSFLNNSENNLLVNQGRLDFLESDKEKRDFYYDLEDRFVETPPDYEENLLSYTGNTWDVWGLTRMRPGQKWYKAHSMTHTENFPSIQSSLTSLVSELMDSVRNMVASRTLDYTSESDSRPGQISNRNETNTLSISKTLVLKDPRLIYTLPLFAQYLSTLPIKLLFVERDKVANLASMRRHYGPRLFSKDVFPGTNWVSNHFNYKIKPQTFDEYTLNYLKFKSDCESLFPNLTINCEQLSEPSTHQRILSFVGERI
jgi:hypothetical protein